MLIFCWKLKKVIQRILSLKTDMSCMVMENNLISINK